MTKCITVSNDTHKQLMMLKIKIGHKSVSKVIDDILFDYNTSRGEQWRLRPN